MKYRILLFSFLLTFITVLSAQTEQNTSHMLNWKGIEKWYAGTSTVNVISFDSAQYPTENHLPYFNKRIQCDLSFSYQAKLKNPVFVALSVEESALLSNNDLIQADPVVSTNILRERGAGFFNVSILPFVKRGGNLMKLQSFDLQITKSALPQKISTLNNRTYTTTSVLAQGTFVKIKVTDSGIYKLTYDDLVKMGVKDPANARVFGYGGAVLEQSFSLTKIDDLPEVAIYVNKASGSEFKSGDYILFYGQGINKWSFDKTKLLFTHKINPYSSYGYYFVSSDGGTGKKIEDENIVVPTAAIIHPIEQFTDYKVYEKELVNLCQSGKEFYGETFSDVTSYTLPFNFPNPVLTNSTTVRVDVAASSTVESNFSLNLNGVQPKVLTVNKSTSGDNYEMAIGTSALFGFTPVSDPFNFNISYIKSTTTSVGYLNYLEVNARRYLKMNSSAMQFQNIDYLGKSSYNQYLLSNANPNVQIWDITDIQNISKIITGTSNGKISFVDSGNDVKSYLAIDPTASNDFLIPEIVGVVPNQNLHAIAQADMVILTHPNFLSQAQTLAQAHRDKDKMTVEVVTTDQVYNEYSSGTPDATAYRWFMKMLYDRALLTNKSDLPKYLLLFGKGTYDNRKLRSDSGDNFILTYEADNSLVLTQSYVTDDYFSFLDDNEGSSVSSDLMDIGVGRFTVTTSQQATDVVNKTIGYMNNQGKGYWKNQICFVADDGDHSLHSTQADSIAVSLTNKFPSFQINKIYLDAFLQVVNASGQSYPIAKTRLLNSIQSGLFLLNYTGHANSSTWSNESVLTLNDIKLLANTHLPLFVAATCDFVQFDNQVFSAGEEVVFNPIGGGISILASSRPVYASQNFSLDKLFCETLLRKQNGEHLRIGDVLAYTKNSIGTEINKLAYVFVGDPAIKLNYPTKYQVITDKINESTSLGNDTLRALSVATIQGYIADDKGNKIDNFNGNIHTVIYDKVQKITTLNNEGDGSMTYSERPNTLFSGDAKVVNGGYSFSFMLPKDIKYNYGGGRINYYANDDTNDYEAQGYFENFIIGGTNKNYVDETDGPKADLYLNSENFVTGDKVNETPVFIANVKDTDGINTVGSGIGHDIMLTIDQDPAQSYVLNDYFQANSNSYSSGAVTYKLPLMGNGKHTLTFRVWDLLNNSTTNSIDFEVVKGLTPEIFTVYNYPNPVKTQTNIIVKHDRPETILNTTVEIYDISGRKIWSFSQSGVDNISWNLVSNNGLRVKTGVYFYRVSIKTKNSDSTSKTNKMLIVE